VACLLILCSQKEMKIMITTNSLFISSIRLSELFAHTYSFSLQPSQCCAGQCCAPKGAQGTSSLTGGPSVHRSCDDIPAQPPLVLPRCTGDAVALAARSADLLSPGLSRGWEPGKRGAMSRCNLRKREYKSNSPPHPPLLLHRQKAAPACTQVNSTR